MVCCEAPERYMADLWNVRFHRERSELPKIPVTGAHGPKEAADAWLQAMPRDIRLHALDLRGSDVTGRGLDCLVGREDLRVLILLNCPRLRTDDLGVIPTLPSLEILVVTGVELDDRALALAGGAGSLRRIQLSGSGITDAGIPHLLGLTKLEHLDLTATSVTGRAAFPQLQRMPSLRQIFLPGQRR
jgi:hypothetical protein